MPGSVGRCQARRWPVRELGPRGIGTAFGIGGLLLWLAFRDGGYFPVTWNIGALVLAGLVAVVLLSRVDVRLSRLDVALLVGWAGVAAWTWLSAVWSIAPATSILEGQRTLLYTAASAGVLLVTSRRRVDAIVVAVLAAITVICGVALADRLGALNPLPYNRLGGPVGYWNALGICAAAGVCLALGLAAHERRAPARALAGVSLPILVCALYLTFSRGSWFALGVGLIAAAGIDSRRRELAGAAVVVTLPCLAVLAATADAHALNTPLAPHPAVVAEAHRLGIFVLLMCGACAGVATCGPRVGARLPGVPFRRLGVGVVACSALVLALIAAGGPARLQGEAASAFDAAPPNSASNLNTHLLTLSGSGRGEMWHIALTGFAGHPLLGTGAGTYGRLWLMGRRQPITIEDAHSVYLETLSELGILGLALLLAVLAIPLVAARRLRHAPYIPALTAAYIAFLAHAAIDWDWEMPIVTMSEIVCGAAIVAAARGDLPPLGRRIRIGGLAVALGLVGCTVMLLIGNRYLSAADAAAANPQSTLRARALAAQRWVPWSPDPSRWLATVQLERGNRPAARRLLSAAIGRDATDWSLWLEMAAASDGKARTDAIDNAVRLDPKGPEVFQAAVEYGLIHAPPPRLHAVAHHGLAIQHHHAPWLRHKAGR